MRLSDLSPGDKGIIVHVKGRGAFRQRILNMGFIEGKEIEVLQRAPLGDPVRYRVMGYEVTLRNEDAALIEVALQEPIESFQPADSPTMEREISVRPADFQKTIHVAFVGNPNSGKTTIFNHASGMREKVGNYAGVTVKGKEARFYKNGYTFVVTDLPGTYSLTTYTPEELFVRDFILNTAPHIVVNVIDTSNLERNLYLTTELIDMDIRVVGLLNMYDEFDKLHHTLDYKKLGRLLGIPLVPAVGKKGAGVDELLDTLIEVYEGRNETIRHIHIPYGDRVERSIQKLQALLRQPENEHYYTRISSRFTSLKLLENDQLCSESSDKLVNAGPIREAVAEEQRKLENTTGKDSESLITQARYSFISGALHETLVHGNTLSSPTGRRIDKFLTHKFWGIPIFLLFMYLMFFTTFKLGAYPVSWIEWLVDQVSLGIERTLPAGILKDFLIQGIIGGVGGVIVFLPNIMLLYFFISLMEDTGYLSRAVFIMDKFMHKIGLHGKSFIPLLMGFGCNVPAIMATRIIESRRDRLVTMLIIPFMSCSARLPVYILLISAFFFKYQALILFGIYTAGVLLAVVTALILNRTAFRRKDVPFVMELPPYRIPTFKAVMHNMWDSAVHYIRKIAGVILIASVIIWALSYFPKPSAQATEQYAAEAARTGVPEDVATANFQQVNSYIGQLGHAVEPVMAPLGFDWKMSVALITGVAAKEVAIGTMGVLYQAGDPETDNSVSLISKLQEQTYLTGPRKGEKVFRPLVALSFIVFILIYFPCVAVIAAIRRESGRWFWALFTIFYTTGVAYMASLLVYQTGRAFGF